MFLYRRVSLLPIFPHLMSSHLATFKYISIFFKHNNYFLDVCYLNPQKAYMALKKPLPTSSKTVHQCSVFVRSNFSVSINIHLSYCWNFACFQLVPKKVDDSNLSNYRSVALISGLSNYFPNYHQ